MDAFEEILRSHLAHDYEKVLSISPKDLTKEDSEYYDMLRQLNGLDFYEVEVIGWFYQFFMAEKHGKIVGLNNGTIKNEDIPAATQIFTPKWIVKYMVDNTLGRIYIEEGGEETFANELEYYIDLRRGKNKCNSFMIENIRFLDPACGCGHILVYAFDVLFKIYIKCGYHQEEIPKLILEKNLYGIDIDEKVINITKFALIVKAYESNPRLETFNLNIIKISDIDKIKDDKDIFLHGIKDIEYGKIQIENLFNLLSNSSYYGSIIEMKSFDKTFFLEREGYFIKKLETEESTAMREKYSIFLKIIKDACILGESYDAVVTNPPYLSKKYMNNILKEYINKFYRDYNGDLFSVFMIRNLKYAKPNGYSAFMTPFVWMFIKEYRALREFIINHKSIVSLIQLEYSSYEDATVPICSLIIRNNDENNIGEYIRLSAFKGPEVQPVKALEAVKNSDVSYRFSFSSRYFHDIPGSPIAYWIPDNFLNVFKKSRRLEDFIEITGSQNITGNNNKYLRKWWEVNPKDIGKRWHFYTKGGEYRKWYGNTEYVVDWSEEAKEFYKKNKTSNLLKEEYCFREGITYNGISIRGFAVRIAGHNIYDKGGPTFHMKDEGMKYYILALLNTKIIDHIMQLYNPTMNYQVQDVKNIPVIIPKDKTVIEKITALSKHCAEISKIDWDCYENSPEFTIHPIIKYKEDSKRIKDAFDNWRKFSEESFMKLKNFEEEINKIFNELYGVEGDLSHEVAEKDITVNKADLIKDIKSFISFAVGCIMGRFILEGVKLSKSIPVCENGIITLCGLKDKEDITCLFVSFLEAVFGKDYLGENLNFISSVLGKRENESPMDTISNYFLKDFYKDHMKVYKERPIYWLLKPGGKNSIGMLIYVHKINREMLGLIRKNYVEQYCNTLKNAEKLKNINNYIVKLKDFEERGTAINLDEGIKNNYNKLKGILI